MNAKKITVRVPEEDWDLISSVAELKREKVADIALEGLKQMITLYLYDHLDGDDDKDLIGDILECDMLGPYDFDDIKKTKGKCKCIFLTD